MRGLFYIIIVFLMSSCKNENIRFPLDEHIMVEQKMYGELLEYAIFDTTKKGLVNSILCDTLKKNENLLFRKMETVIGDSSYYFFHLKEYEPMINDYIGMIYVDINNFDSIYMYSFDERFKYKTSEFIKVIHEIANHNNKSIEETLKHRKINNKFIPHFYFVVMTDTNCYKEDFVAKVIYTNEKINSLMKSICSKVFENEKVMIEPNIEITSIYTEVYKSRFNYYPLHFKNEEVDLFEK